MAYVHTCSYEKLRRLKKKKRGGKTFERREELARAYSPYNMKGKIIKTLLNTSEREEEREREWKGTNEERSRSLWSLLKTSILSLCSVKGGQARLLNNKRSEWRASHEKQRSPVLSAGESFADDDEITCRIHKQGKFKAIAKGRPPESVKERALDDSSHHFSHSRTFLRALTKTYARSRGRNNIIMTISRENNDTPPRN